MRLVGLSVFIEKEVCVVKFWVISREYRNIKVVLFVHFKWISPFQVDFFDCTFEVQFSAHGPTCNFVPHIVSSDVHAEVLFWFFYIFHAVFKLSLKAVYDNVGVYAQDLSTYVSKNS